MQVVLMFIKIVKLAFNLFTCASTANKVGDGLNLVAVHYCRTDSGLAYSVPDHSFLE